MKIAICYSGMARTILDTFANHREMLINQYDCDIYFSFWDCWGHGNVFTKYNSTPDDVLLESEKQLICSTLNPKSFEFEVFKDYENILYNLLAEYNQYFPFCKNVLSMHYKIYKCMNLVKNSTIKYDVVFRMRADHLLKKRVHLKPTIKNSFYTNLDPVACNISGINDQIGYGDTDSMNIYSNLYTNFKSIFSQFETFNPEVVFKRYLDSVNLQSYHDDLVHRILAKDNIIR